MVTRTHKRSRCLNRSSRNEDRRGNRSDGRMDDNTPSPKRASPSAERASAVTLASIQLQLGKKSTTGLMLALISLSLTKENRNKTSTSIIDSLVCVKLFTFPSLIHLPTVSPLCIYRSTVECLSNLKCSRCCSSLAARHVAPHTPPHIN